MNDCSRCETTCEKCKPKHHRDMETKHYKQTIQVPRSLVLKLLESEYLEHSARLELLECIND